MNVPINFDDYKADEATCRFYNKLIESVKMPEQLVTPTSNSSGICKTTNPFRDIVNIAFSMEPKTAKELEPVIDIITDAFTAITLLKPQKPTEVKKTAEKPTEVKKTAEKPTEVKKTVEKPTASATCCPVTKCNSNVSGATQSSCPFIGSKTKDVSTKLEKLRAEVQTLPGGENYLKKVDTDTVNVIAHLLEKQYQEMLSFRETAKPAKVSTTLADIVHRLKPNAMLPENAKNTLVTYVNARRQTYPYLHKIDTKFEVDTTPNGLVKVDAIVTQWLNENSGMYVVV